MLILNEKKVNPPELSLLHPFQKWGTILPGNLPVAIISTHHVVLVGCNKFILPVVLLSLEGKARRAVLELDIGTTLNVKDGMKKLYEKLDTLFLEDANRVVFMAYKSFEQYQRTKGTSIDSFSQILSVTLLN